MSAFRSVKYVNVTEILLIKISQDHVSLSHRCVHYASQEEAMPPCGLRNFFAPVLGSSSTSTGASSEVSTSAAEASFSADAEVEESE